MTRSISTVFQTGQQLQSDPNSGTSKASAPSSVPRKCVSNNLQYGSMDADLFAGQRLHDPRPLRAPATKILFQKEDP
jgi:hypothetical protein